MGRPRHPDKHIESAVKYAESIGWVVNKSAGRAHSWGILYCPRSTREGCKVGVYSTPRNPENHANQIRREVDMCPHVETGQAHDPGEDDDDEDAG